MADPDKIAKFRQQRRELEIEADHVLHNPYDPTRALSEEDRVNLARIHKLIAGIDAALEAEVSGARPGKLITYEGTEREFAKWIREALCGGHLPEAQERASVAAPKDPGLLSALEMAVQHFLWKDPRKPDQPAQRFKAKNVYASLKSEETYQKPPRRS
jgi:hypothetical protein